MPNIGENHHNAKLTNAKVRAIRYLYYVKGLKRICISQLYGVNNQTLFDVIHYYTWKHVEDNFKADQIIQGIREPKGRVRYEAKS